MRTFELTATSQTRGLIAVLVFSLSLLASVFLATEIDNLFLKIIVPIIFFGGVNGIAIYASYGQLTVISDESKLKFRWADKIIFNFEHIDDIHLADIKTLIIEKDPNGSLGFLRKVITGDRVVRLGLGKWARKDANSFILHLHLHSKARAIDSWDEWKERGFLGITYLVTTVILVAGAGFFIWIVAHSGIENIEIQARLMFVSSYFTLLSYWLVIKKKINKNWWQQKH